MTIKHDAADPITGEPLQPSEGDLWITLTEADRRTLAGIDRLCWVRRDDGRVSKATNANGVDWSDPKLHAIQWVGVSRDDYINSDVVTSMHCVAKKNPVISIAELNCVLEAIPKIYDDSDTPAAFDYPAPEPIEEEDPTGGYETYEEGAFYPDIDADVDTVSAFSHAGYFNPAYYQAKADKEKLQPSLIIDQFPRAILALSELGAFGAKKYSREGWKAVPDAHTRYNDAMLRHLLARAQGEALDGESKARHLTAVVWNALALLELEILEEAKGVL